MLPLQILSYGRICVMSVIRSRFLQNHNHSHQISPRKSARTTSRSLNRSHVNFKLITMPLPQILSFCFVLVKDLRFLQGQNHLCSLEIHLQRARVHVFVRDRHRTQIHPLITTRSPDGTYHPFWAAVVIVDMEEDFARCRAGEEC